MVYSLKQCPLVSPWRGGGRRVRVARLRDAARHGCVVREVGREVGREEVRVVKRQVGREVGREAGRVVGRVVVRVVGQEVTSVGAVCHGRRQLVEALTPFDHDYAVAAAMQIKMPSATRMRKNGTGTERRMYSIGSSTRSAACGLDGSSS